MVAFIGQTSEMNRKKSAYWLQKINQEDGFSYLSALFSLFVFSVIMTLMIPYIGLLGEYIRMHPYEQYSTSQFLHLLQDELFNAVQIEADGHTLLIYTAAGSTIKYEQYNNMVRRQVNDTGHELMLTNVHSISFEKFASSINIQIQMKNGEQYERRLAVSVQPYP